MGVKRVGFLGLGAMGSGMAARLLDTGFSVAVHNRSAEKAAPLAERGARVAADAADAASDVDVLLVSLATEEAIDDTVFAEHGPLELAADGTVVANLSTVSPEAARTFADRVEQAGHRALDACVLGNARHARDGELRFMVGGDEADLAAVRPVFDVLSKEIVHLGGHGKGAVAKVAMNLIMGVQLQVLAEAVVLGERAGLPRDRLLDMITASGYSSPVMRFKGGVMARRAFESPDFRLALMRKDLMLALDEAHRHGVAVPATTASYEVLTAAVEDGLGELDCAAVLAEVERAAAPRPRE